MLYATQTSDRNGKWNCDIIFINWHRRRLSTNQYRQSQSLNHIRAIWQNSISQINGERMTTCQAAQMPNISLWKQHATDARNYRQYPLAVFILQKCHFLHRAKPQCLRKPHLIKCLQWLAKPIFLKAYQCNLGQKYASLAYPWISINSLTFVIFACAISFHVFQTSGHPVQWHEWKPTSANCVKFTQHYSSVQAQVTSSNKRVSLSVYSQKMSFSGHLSVAQNERVISLMQQRVINKDSVFVGIYLPPTALPKHDRSQQLQSKTAKH